MYTQAQPASVFEIIGKIYRGRSNCRVITRNRPITYYTWFLFVYLFFFYCDRDAHEIRLSIDVDVTGDKVFMEQFLN